jgi:hypothetical protein
MTLDEAIKEIKDASDSEVRYGDKEHHYDEVMKRIEAFDLAIRALRATDPSRLTMAESEDCTSEEVADIILSIARNLEHICEVMRNDTR